jgi:hypothetical protein
MVAKIQASGGRAEAALLPGKTHFTANHEVGAEGDESGGLMLKFLRDGERE